MLPLRYANRWQLAGVLLLIAVFASTLVPAIWFRSEFNMRFLVDSDKLAHFLTFLVLAVWFSGQYAARSWWRIAIGLLAFGIIIELCQRMTSYRSAEWFDLLADVVGIATGLAIAAIGAGGWSLRFEHWLQERRAPQE